MFNDCYGPGRYRPVSASWRWRPEAEQSGRGKRVLYDVKEDINQIPSFKDLITTEGLWKHFALDESRTCVYWNDQIDLPSDSIYEYGQLI